MDNFKIDIDLIFNTLSGRALLLVNDNGIIVKANFDAAVLVGKSKIKDLEGKKWDLTFAKLSSDNFSFSAISNSITSFSNFALADTSSDKSELIKVKVDPVELTDGIPGKYYFISCRKQESKDWEDMLFQVMKGTEKDFGENYIQSVTKALAKTLSVDFAFIGKLEGSSKIMVHALSFWNKNKYRKPFKYALAGTPCEDIINKSQKLISRNVAQLYPKDTGLVKLGIESYFGTPIYYSSGEPMGLIVVMDSKPMLESSASAYILNIFANRVGAELEWAETQKSLAETGRKLRNVIDAIPHPIFYKDKNGRYEGINQAFMDSVQLQEANILGRKSIRRDNVTKMASHDKKLLSKADTITYESDQEQKAGIIKQYLMTKSSIIDDNGEIEGLVGSAMDITDLKLAEKELKVNEEKYRTLFSSANDAIFIMNKDLFVDCNTKTLEMFECSRDEIIGHPPYEYSPKKQPDGLSSKNKALERINEALNGTSQNFYWKHKKKTGATFDAEVSLNAFYIGKELFIQAIVRDVTDKIQLANTVEIQKERMEEMYKYISDSDISFKDQLASLLELATKSLGMEVGLLSRIEGKDYSIIDFINKSPNLAKNKIYNLNDTYCDITYDKDRLVAIPEMKKSEYSRHSCYKKFAMESYIGAPYWVKGKRYGTLAFMSPEAINKFRPIDLDFVQMLAQWIGSAMERSQFEENLLERDALLETMLREIPVDFSVRDANLNMVIQSDLSKEYWGNNEGKPIDFKDVDKRSASRWLKIFKSVLGGETVKGEDNVEIYGKAYSFYSIASPVKIKGKVSEIIVINIDISKIKKTEEKLVEKNKQLTKLNSELDRFVYSASHDLRAPLASLLGLIDLSTRERNTESTTHYLELMSKSINTMDRFIADITEYSRNLRLDTIANLIDFNKLVKDSFEHVQYMMPGPASYLVNITGDLPFYTDYERLKIVVNNLISNSIRYKAYGREPVIKFNVDVSENNTRIEVIDNGVGIEEKHLNRVFEMFYRGSDKNVGSGLGLFIVKETIDKLAGSVIITSELGIGTKVFVEIPNLSAVANTSS
jgi:PAS domain S-box-containing protein